MRPIVDFVLLNKYFTSNVYSFIIIIIWKSDDNDPLHNEYITKLINKKL